MTVTSELLEELEEELEGTLHVIAHAGYASDIDYIRKSQEYFRKKYGHVVDDNAYKIVNGEESEPEIAYAKFMSVLNNDPNSNEIAKECENILFDHILFR